MAWPIIAAVVAALGSAVSASAQYNSAKTNVKIAENNAELARRKTLKDEQMLRDKRRKEIGRLRSKMSSSGAAISGSLLDVLDESFVNSEMDVAELRLDGEQKATNFENQARIARSSKKNAVTSGILGVASAAAGGYSGSGGSFGGGSSGSLQGTWKP